MGWRTVGIDGWPCEVAKRHKKQPLCDFNVWCLGVNFLADGGMVSLFFGWE